MKLGWGKKKETRGEKDRLVCVRIGQNLAAVAVLSSSEQWRWKWAVADAKYWHKQNRHTKKNFITPALLKNKVESIYSKYKILCSYLGDKISAGKYYLQYM